MLKLRIDRAGAYAKLSKLSIELVLDPIDSKKNIFIDINSFEDIDNLSFDIEESYVLADELKAREQRTSIENSIKEEIKKTSDKKTSVKKQKMNNLNN
jgi:hypothetical protein